jgi:uncharacterized DUF497 family protein
MRYHEITEAVSPEHWETMRLPSGEEINVGWQTAKDAQNRRRHDLSLRDVIPIITNPRSEYTLDYDNPNLDERARYVGQGNRNMVLVVAVEWINTDSGEENASIRIISVRQAEAHEIDGDQMNEDAKPNEPQEIDPDNPPLTGKEIWRPAQEHIAQMIARHKARVAARKTQGQNPKAAE